MSRKRGWLLLGGVVAAAITALALGASLSTLLVLALVLLCPAAMYFGMSGMRSPSGCGHSQRCNHSDAHAAEQNKGLPEDKKAA